MKYQARIILGNFDTWEEANAARKKLLLTMSLKELNKLIATNIVDSSVRNYGIYS